MQRACGVRSQIEKALLEVLGITHPQISTTISFRQNCQLVLEGFFYWRSPSGSVDIENLASALQVGKREVELAVESSWSTKGRINRVGTICGSDDDDLT